MFPAFLKLLLLKVLYSITHHEVDKMVQMTKKNLWGDCSKAIKMVYNQCLLVKLKILKKKPWRFPVAYFYHVLYNLNICRWISFSCHLQLDINIFLWLSAFLKRDWGFSLQKEWCHNVAKLLKYLFPLWGIPREISGNRACHFTGQIIKKWNKILQTQWHSHYLHHP